MAFLWILESPVIIKGRIPGPCHSFIHSFTCQILIIKNPTRECSWLHSQSPMFSSSALRVCLPASSQVSKAKGAGVTSLWGPCTLDIIGALSQLSGSHHKHSFPTWASTTKGNENRAHMSQLSKPPMPWTQPLRAVQLQPPPLTPWRERRPRAANVSPKSSHICASQCKCRGGYFYLQVLVECVWWCIYNGLRNSASSNCPEWQGKLLEIVPCKNNEPRWNEPIKTACWWLPV